jgi:hypothetical protein
MTPTNRSGRIASHAALLPWCVWGTSMNSSATPTAIAATRNHTRRCWNRFMVQFVLPNRSLESPFCHKFLRKDTLISAYQCGRNGLIRIIRQDDSAEDRSRGVESGIDPVNLYQAPPQMVEVGVGRYDRRAAQEGSGGDPHIVLPHHSLST